MFKTVFQRVEAELIEKKSKFIATIYYIESVKDAENIIKDHKKKYFDARHNCFAFRVLQNGENVNRFSDDGEPSGTAGAPMLNLLEKQEITNTLIIVTRYFGGILLGTGGLVKAYTEASKIALEKTKIVEKAEGLELIFTISYSDFQKFQYYMQKNQIKMIKNEYLEQIKCTVEITEEKLEKILSKRNELNFEMVDFQVLRKKIIDINSDLSIKK